MTSNTSAVAILGAGNLGTAIARGLAASGRYAPEHIVLTRRRVELLADLERDGFRTSADNREAAASADVLILCVQPQQLDELMDEVAGSLRPERQVVVSTVSGAGIGEMRRRLGVAVPVIRAMPNLGISIRESMTCLAADESSMEAVPAARAIFDSVGRTLLIQEEQMVPATALCACGIAFFLRAIRAASQGGIEIGFHADEAIFLAAQTARGAAQLLLEHGNHPESEIDRVTTPKGCTIAGLNEMENRGFSSALIRGIITSTDRAALLYRPGE